MSKSSTSNPHDTATAQTTTIMFGDTLPTVFDSIHAGLHEIIRSQVSTLPIIQSSTLSSLDKQEGGDKGEENDMEESCDEKIYKRISKVYAKHMDMAHLYAERELFSLDKNWTRRKREKVVNAFLSLLMDQARHGEKSNDDHPKDDEQSQMQPNDKHHTEQEEQLASNNTEVLRYNIPRTREEIPTMEEFKALRDEITHLRQELRDCMGKKHLYHRQLLALQRAADASGKVDESLSNHMLIDAHQQKKAAASAHDPTFQAVKDAVDGQKELKKLIGDGKELIQEMDKLTKEKNQRNNVNVDETLEFGEIMKARALEAAKGVFGTEESHDGHTNHNQNHRKRTLEDDYKERKEKTHIKGDVLKLFQKK